MKFAMLGFCSLNGMLTHIGNELRKLGHEVYMISTLDYVMHYCTRRLYKSNYIPMDNYLKGYPCPLSGLYEEFPEVDHFDIIYVEQANLIFKNDVDEDTIVVYYHRDLPGTFNVHLPDLLLYRFEEVPLFLKVYHRHAWYSVLYKAKMYNGINPSVYKSDKRKKFKGIVWFGTYNPLEFYMKKDVIQHDYYENTFRIKEYGKDNNLINCLEHRTDRVPFSWYKHIMERSEAYLIIPGRNAYLTRICYEAAVCNTIIVIWVQNEKAKKVYEEWGLIDEVNCLMFENVEELHDIKAIIDSDLELKETLRENAYDWVMNNHTYKIRAKQLLVLIEHTKIYQKQRLEEKGIYIKRKPLIKKGELKIV